MALGKRGPLRFPLIFSPTKEGNANLEVGSHLDVHILSLTCCHEDTKIYIYIYILGGLLFRQMLWKCECCKIFLCLNPFFHLLERTETFKKHQGGIFKSPWFWGQEMGPNLTLCVFCLWISTPCCRLWTKSLQRHGVENIPMMHRVVAVMVGACRPFGYAWSTIALIGGSSTIAYIDLIWHGALQSTEAQGKWGGVSHLVFEAMKKICLKTGRSGNHVDDVLYFRIMGVWLSCWFTFLFACVYPRWIVWLISLDRFPCFSIFLYWTYCFPWCVILFYGFYDVRHPFTVFSFNSCCETR